MLPLQGGHPVTPQLHTESPPRVPGCESGHAPKRYPADRVCVACPTVLRRTNPGPWCDPCLTRARASECGPQAAAATPRRKPSASHECVCAKCGEPFTSTRSNARYCSPQCRMKANYQKKHSGPPASACSEAAPTAAPAAHATKEEKVGKESLREAVLLAFARDPSRCFNAGDVVKSCGVSPSCAYKNLKALVASGEIVRDGPGVYRWPTIEDVKTAPATPPAPAPASPPPEQPADVAPASELLRPQAGLAPFAGIDYELVVIGEVVRRIESLTGHETRIRVAAYVAARFLP